MDGLSGSLGAPQFASRYAGAMLLHAFFARTDAGSALPASGDRRPADVALLSAVSMCFALGADTIEQFKHLAAADAGPLAGLAVLPGLRTLRPVLARIADGADPVAVQAMFAAAMLTADPVTSGVYYVDDHFVPYTGAKPVAKGWNNKRGRAERGRADTHVTAHDGRAVCFVTGEPSGLSVTLPKALAELRKAAAPGARIMLGFDRGGAYPQVFAHCRSQDVHWVTYRRAPLAVPVMLPVITTITYGGRTRQIAWAEETVQVKDSRFLPAPVPAPCPPAASPALPGGSGRDRSDDRPNTIRCRTARSARSFPSSAACSAFSARSSSLSSRSSAVSRASSRFASSAAASTSRSDTSASSESGTTPAPTVTQHSKHPHQPQNHAPRASVSQPTALVDANTPSHEFRILTVGRQQQGVASGIGIRQGLSRPWRTLSTAEYACS